VTRLDDLRELNERLSADEPRLWARCLRTVCALGLAVRGGVHAWTVLFAVNVLDDDLDLSLGDTDVTAQSPIMGLRGHRLDEVARLCTLVAGLGIWYLSRPLAGGRPLVTQVILVSAIAVCVADPLLFVVEQLADDD
jgi:hypothetical protein